MYPQSGQCPYCGRNLTANHKCPIQSTPNFKEIRMTRTARQYTYYAGPETDEYLAVEVGNIQLNPSDNFCDGDEIEIKIILKKKENVHAH
jgi:hypothetical protein